MELQGPPALVALPAATGPNLGCALLPQGLLWAGVASGAATLQAAPPQSGAEALLVYRTAGGHLHTAHPLSLSLDPATALPARAAWTAYHRGTAQSAAITYSDWTDGSGVRYPATVVESVGGVARLSIHFDSFTAHPGFQESDFALPPPRIAPGVRSAGGGQ